MAETINIASHLPMAVRLFEPFENPEKPGEGREPRSFVIGGKAHPDSTLEVVTRGVDAEIYKLWLKANPHHPIVLNDSVREVSDEEADDLENPERIYGFEAGLERASKDGDNQRNAGDGSVEGDKPASEVDMNVHSNDDTANLRGGLVKHGDSPVDTVDEHPHKPVDEHLADPVPAKRFDPETGKPIGE